MKLGGEAIDTNELGVRGMLSDIGDLLFCKCDIGDVKDKVGNDNVEVGESNASEYVETKDVASSASETELSQLHSPNNQKGKKEKILEKKNRRSLKKTNKYLRLRLEKIRRLLLLEEDQRKCY